MLRYLFTNDLRISSLDFSVKEAAELYLSNTVPSATEDKSKNNNVSTLGFYFSLKNGSECSKIAAAGDVRKVVLNFIKKFQFPNMRTRASFESAIQDNIKLAPMRVILKLLYIFYVNEGERGHLSIDEMKEFIFFNSDVATARTPDLIKVYCQIKDYRENGTTEATIVPEEQRQWNNDMRQIREMVKILTWSGCVQESERGIYKIKHEHLSEEEKADIFDILTCNSFWGGNTLEDYNEYMDLDQQDINMTDIIHETEESYTVKNLRFKTGLQAEFERNRIVFGAPGTGKSYGLKDDCQTLMNGNDSTYERVTFHPDYSYAHFVGTYKPVTDESESEIKYEFVPGPFMRVYVEAIKSGRTDNPQPHLLLIEEINRAKVAAVFGDVFQLLDRDDDGVSEYEIHASEDIRKFLAKELEGNPDSFKRIRIPDNMFIWATMNSADQGVFPMDTAFKRRWDFEYLSIDKNDDGIKGKITLGTDSYEEEIEWNQLRKAINEKLAEVYKVNEDKLMGPYFLSKKVIKTVSDTDNTIDDVDKFKNAFKNKVIMYLYEDAAKQHKHKLFDGCNSAGYSTAKYSSVCEAFEKMGIHIFGDSFKELYDKQGV